MQYLFAKTELSSEATEAERGAIKSTWIGAGGKKSCDDDSGGGP